MTKAMSQFGFYKVGGDIVAPLSIVAATDAEEARRLAVEAIKTEGLEAIRSWIDGSKTIEVKRPARSAQPASKASPADERRERMRARISRGRSVLLTKSAAPISRPTIRSVTSSLADRNMILP